MERILRKYYRTLEEIFRDDLHIDLREPRFSEIVDILKDAGIWNVKKFIGLNDFVETSEEIFDYYLENWDCKFSPETIYVYPEIINQIADVLADLNSLPTPFYDYGYWGFDPLEYLDELTPEGLDLFFVFFSYENLAKGAYPFSVGEEFARLVDEELEKQGYLDSLEYDDF